MKVSFLNLKKLHEPLRIDLMDAYASLIDRCDFVHGPDIAAFEEEFADFSGSTHCVAVANGTDAITMLLRASGIEAGDEVILPANTFVATAEAVIAAGASIRLVDVQPDTLLMDARLVRQVTGPKSRWLLPVHLYGQMADMQAICETANELGLRVIEDAAQAHGALDSEGRSPGSLSLGASYSFFPGKNLGAFGDAGCIVTNHPKVTEMCRKLRNHGGLKKYVHEVVGYNSRMDTLQAKVLRIKLKHLAKWTEARRQVASWYGQGLQGVGDLILPVEAPGFRHAYHLYVVRTERRDELKDFLISQGVEVGLHYPKPIHQLPAFQSLQRESKCPVADKAAQSMLSIPMCPTLTQAEVSYVIQQIAAFFGSGR